MTTTASLMASVYELVKNGDYMVAQREILAADAQNASIVPASLYELVLRRALSHDLLLDEYADLCRSRFGRETYAHMVQTAVNIALGKPS